MKKTTFIFALAFLLAVFSSGRTSAQAFTDILTDIPGLGYEAVLTCGDYDNDGDLDVLVTGYSDVDSRSYTKIYRNNGDNTFTDIAANLPGIWYENLDWGDYDNDGDLDLVISGNGNTFLYRNDGGDVFTFVTVDIDGASFPVVSWVDHDNDGDLDLFLSGKNNDTGDAFSAIYINMGADVFIDAGIRLKACKSGDVSWGDYNKDHFPDLLMAGEDINGDNHLTLLRNVNGKEFVEQELPIPAGFTRFYHCDWGDYDGDGDLDILAAGYSGYIFRNDSTSFSYIQVDWDGFRPNVCSWGDYDNDGDLDILGGGRLVNDKYTMIYENQGNSSFIRLGETFFGAESNDLDWGDFDNDGKLDFMVTGLQNGAYPSCTRLYKNNLATGNQKPSIPAGLYSHDGYNVSIGWDAASDSETGSLSYNVMLGNANNNIGIISPHADTVSGYYRLAKYGNMGLQTKHLVSNIPEGDYFWKVQAIDNIYAASEFSERNYFSVLPEYSIIKIGDKGGYSGSVDLGDYDGDDDLDILVTGFTGVSSMSSNTSLYRNDGNLVFTEISNTMPDLVYGSARWGDYDNDGDLDIALSGQQVVEGSYLDFQLKIYENTGNDVFNEVPHPLNSDKYGPIAWGDYDNDGDLDLVVPGNKDYHSGSYILKNEGNNTFLVADYNFDASTDSYLAFADIDNDNDLDISMEGQLSGTRIYRNELINNGGFTDLVTGIPDCDGATIDWADFDNDGDSDLLICGLNRTNTTKMTRVYRNSGGQLTEIQTPLRQITAGRALWIDYNNDGYQDVVLSGESGNSITKVYENLEGEDFEELRNITPGYQSSSIAAGDIDNDGDIDIIRAEGTELSLIRNNENTVNRPPSAPVNLREDYINKSVVLQWDASDDDGGQNGGLSYNVRIGTTPGAIDIVCPMSNLLTGYRSVCNMGNAGVNREFRIDSLPTGTYYWSVQAIDQGFKGGAWSQEHSFEVTVLRAEFTFDTVCLGAGTSFQDASVTAGLLISGQHWDFGDGTSSSAVDPVHTYAASGSYLVSYIASSDTYSDTIVKTVSVKPKPVAAFQADPVCYGDPTLFENQTDIQGLTISKWKWEFGDGQFSESMDPGSHYYAQSGSFNCKLVAVTDNGCSDSLVQDVEIAVYPASGISVGGNLEFCEGQELMLRVPENAGYTYQWKIGAAPLADADSSVYFAKVTGDYTVLVTNQLAGCTSESSEAVSVMVYPTPPQPLILVDDPDAFCDGDSALLFVTKQSDTDYYWKLNGGVVGANTNMYYAKSGGSYSLELINNQGCGTESLNKVEITVYEAPLPPALNLGGPTTFCEGGEVVLGVSEPETGSYQWINQLGEIAGETGSSLTVDQTGQYKVRLRNAGMCDAFSQEIPVIVNAYPIIPVINTGNYVADACPDEDPVVLSIQTAESDVSYQWSLDGINISGATSSGLTGYLAEGVYKLAAERNNCSVSSEALTISYADIPAKPGIIAEGPNIWYLACTNDSATIYKWYLDGEEIEGADGSIYVAGTTEGRYEVAVSENGSCFAKSDPLWIPVGTGLELNPWENLKIYPNPTPGLFTLEMDNPLMGDLLIDIFQETGARIINIRFHKETAHFKTEIDLGDQSAGLYLIGLMIEEYEATRNLIVE